VKAVPTVDDPASEVNPLSIIPLNVLCQATGCGLPWNHDSLCRGMAVQFAWNTHRGAHFRYFRAVTEKLASIPLFCCPDFAESQAPQGIQAIRE
jgi:hypothetical protein